MNGDHASNHVEIPLLGLAISIAAVTENSRMCATGAGRFISRHIGDHGGPKL
jgi:hypothetical protein